MALLGLLAPAPAAAQAAEACGIADTLLMHCTFDNGAKQVGLCLNDDTISYQFGPNFSAPELTLAARFADLDYVPYGWASNTIFESVMLRNGDTTYDVFMSTRRTPNAGPAEGGIIVTSPDQSRVTLTCDPGSVVPHDPLEGIGKLTALVYGTDLNPLSRCLKALSDNPEAGICIGEIREAEIADGTCDPSSGTDMTGCWGTESDYWFDLVDVAYDNALLSLEGHYDTTLVDKLKASQASWLAAQEVDCQLEGRYPFAADGGAAQCRAENAAARLSFISAVLGFAEFQG